MAIFDGKKFAEKIINNLEKEIKKLPALRLAVILIGDDPASLNYIKQKEKVAEKIGINFKLYKFQKNISGNKFKTEIKKIIADKKNTGVIIQLPILKKFNEQEILNIIPPKKDVDALSVDNHLVNPPAASAIMEILKFYRIKIKGKNVVIVGNGKLVGRPLSKMMQRAGANLTLCNKQTKDIALKTLGADILISAVGRPSLIKKNFVKKGTIVIDAGFSRIKKKIMGDVDFEGVRKKAAHITPVPGGVGPVTVAMLFSNLIKLAKIKK